MEPAQLASVVELWRQIVSLVLLMPLKMLQIDAFVMNTIIDPLALTIVILAIRIAKLVASVLWKLIATLVMITPRKMLLTNVIVIQDTLDQLPVAHPHVLLVNYVMEPAKLAVLVIWRQIVTLVLLMRRKMLQINAFAMNTITDPQALLPAKFAIRIAKLAV